MNSNNKVIMKYVYSGLDGKLYENSTEWQIANLRFKIENLENVKQEHFDCLSFIDNEYKTRLYQRLTYLLKNEL